MHPGWPRNRLGGPHRADPADHALRAERAGAPYSDIVNELPIIRREFRAGVGAFQVISTKWLVYAMIAVSQAALITAVFCLFPDRAPQRSVMYGPQTDLFVSLAALSVSAMTLGLLVSPWPPSWSMRSLSSR